MKFTKPLIIAALAASGLFAGSLALPAQDATNAPPAGAPPGGGRGMRGGPNVDRIATELNLTDDQKAKVKPILDAERQKMSDLRADTSLSREDRMAKMRTIREDTAKQMKDVLTPEQFDKYQQMFQRGRRNAPPPGGATNTPPANPPQN